MTWYNDFLKKFFHDPIDKPLDIPTHEERAKKYAEFFNISGIEEGKYSDQIASCMERSLLPKGIKQDFNEVRHPLSQGEMKVSLDKQSINEIYRLLKEFSVYYEFQSSESKSFLIWRNLLDEILEKVQDEELKKFIPILPADTRVPDHSIWEHLKITTVINAFENYQNNSLFLFTIGPVQSFISQARKTQDFYMGSFILSYFTFIAMKKVIENYGPTSIIYPDLYKQPLMDWFLKNKKGLEIKNFDKRNITLPTIPNRFVAIIGTTDEGEIKNLVNCMKKKIKDEIKNAIEEIFENLKIELSDNQKKILENQISDFPQTYWVAISWKKGNNDLQIDDLKDFFTDEKLNNWKKLHNFAKEKGEFPPNIGFIYQLIYTALEKSIGARKNLREFEQKEEAGRKCSVCGERNVLFYRDEENPLFILDNLKYFYYGKKEKKENNIIKLNKEKITYKILGSKEGLCTLCFFKRTFEIYLENRVDKEIFKDFSFPSTAEVACSDFKEKAKDLPEFKEYEDEFFEYISVPYLKIKSLPKLKMIETLEGSWFYEENLTEKKFIKELGIEISSEKIKKLKELLRKIYDKIGKPNSYYALIYLDGDNMGKWLSGELLPEIQYAYNSEVWNKMPNEFKEGKKEKNNKNKEEGLIQLAPKKILTPAIHSAISTALRNYTIEFVKKIIEEEHLGKLIYAGGDDVLAFVNLKDLLDVIEKLRWAFSGQIKFEDGKIYVDINNTSGFVLKEGVYYLTMGTNATCSVGVVIAHYKGPLKIVIDKVFEMKKKAKNDGKNRFAICLMKHSGEERVGVAEWMIESDLTTQILKKLKDWMNRDRKEKRYISDRFIQKLKQEFIKLKETPFWEEIINTELKRLITRAYKGQPRESKKEKTKFINDFINSVKKLLWNTGADIDNFTNLLEIASFMNKGE